MALKTILFIAFRYLFSRNKKQAINVLSFITMFAMGCGAAALIVILSTFNGFENLSTSLNESFQPDIIVQPSKNKQFNIADDKLEAIQKNKYIAAVSKVLEEKVYVQYKGASVLATIKGVDASYFNTNQIKDYVIEGDTILENDNYNFAMLGVGIAQRLNINLNNQFETLSIYAPKTLGGGMQLQDNFELGYLIPGGVFSIYQDYDEKYIIAPIGFVQYMMNKDVETVSALEIRLGTNNIAEAKSSLQQILGDGFTIKSKMEMNETFYRISRVEKLVTFFILSFILIILSFNFIGSLTMHIIEKQNDIKMLHYLGLKSSDVFRLYLSYGTLQGLWGGLLGLTVGVGICVIQHYFGIIKMPGSGTFVIQDYPVMIYWQDVVLIFLLLVGVSFLASIFPALKAQRDVKELV